jgi:hypothetical protein
LFDLFSFIIKKTDLFSPPNSTTKHITLDGNNDPSTAQTIKQKWNSLSHGAQIAIVASAAGAALLAVVAFAFFCVRQRRAGRRERELEDAAWQKNSAELMAYRAAMEKQYQAQLQQQQSAPIMPSGRNSWMFGGQRGFQRF